MDTYIQNIRNIINSDNSKIDETSKNEIIMNLDLLEGDLHNYISTTQFKMNKDKIDYNKSLNDFMFSMENFID